MKWEGDRQSDDVEDRRDEGAVGPGLPFGVGRGLGLGGVLVALVAAWVLGIDPVALLGLLGGGAPAVAPRPPHAQGAAEAREVAFVRTVLADTEDVWTAQFQARGAAYRHPTLVLFRGATRTACGQGRAAMGPFYCPADERVYIDLAFYDTLRRSLGAPGDFAQAYVIAHEVGHHVQKLLGISAKVEAARRGLDEARANALSVRLELQVDCFAGIWAHDAERSRQLLEAGDLEEALNAASRIGDDALQRQARGVVVPESFTHGTSAQRVRWFREGWQDGRLEGCDTFRATSL